MGCKSEARGTLYAQRGKVYLRAPECANGVCIRVGEIRFHARFPTTRHGMILAS